MPASLSLSTWKYKNFVLFIITLKKNDIFLVEANRLVIKILDIYRALAMWSSKIVTHGGFIGEYLMEKSCSWKTENKLGWWCEFYFKTYQLSIR